MVNETTRFGNGTQRQSPNDRVLVQACELTLSFTVDARGIVGKSAQTER
jgi:hypothetical protein